MAACGPRGGGGIGAAFSCWAALAVLAACLATADGGESASGSWMACLGGEQLPGAAVPGARAHDLARAGGRPRWQAGPLGGWRAAPQQHSPCTRRRVMLLRGGGGGDAEARMEVDGGTHAAGIDAEQPGGTGGMPAQAADAPASGAVNVTIRWKLSSFPLEIDTWQPADVLKHQLFSITQVLPEDQFLIGVYQPAQDANLRDLDLKDSQTLILLGEPVRPPPRSAPAAGREPDAGARKAAGGRAPEASAPGGAGKGPEENRMETDDDGATAVPDGESSPAPTHSFTPLPKRGFFSFVNRIADDDGQYLRELQDNVTGIENPLEEVVERLNKTNLFTADDATAHVNVSEVCARAHAHLHASAHPRSTIPPPRRMTPRHPLNPARPPSHSHTRTPILTAHSRKFIYLAMSTCMYMYDWM